MIKQLTEAMTCSCIPASSPRDHANKNNKESANSLENN